MARTAATLAGGGGRTCERRVDRPGRAAARVSDFRLGLLDRLLLTFKTVAMRSLLQWPLAPYWPSPGRADRSLGGHQGQSAIGSDPSRDGAETSSQSAILGLL